MSKKAKHINCPEDFLRYSSDKMSHEERNAFEKKMQKDPFDYDASEGLSSISSEEATRDLKQLKSQIQKRTRSSSKLIWYRIAATVAILFIVSSVFYTVIKNRIEKGTGQLIVSETTSPQKEENEPDELQSISPEEPADTKLPNAGASGVREKPKSRSMDAGNEKKSNTPENGTVQKEKAKTTEESSDLDTKDTFIPSASSAPQKKEMIIQEERSENTNDQTFMNEPKLVGLIKGIVLSSEDHTPLPGVNVKVKGTIQGTITDIHGLFTIPASKDSSTILIAQYDGMKSKEIILEDISYVKVEMETDNASLAEAVVVGYGSKNRSSVNRSASMKVQSQIPDSHPVPVTGNDGFDEYVRKNQVFPSTNLKITRAKVILNFLVKLDGTTDSIIAVKSPGEEFSAEAIRLLKEGPVWIPATNDGQKVVQATQVKIIINSTKE